MTQSRDVTGRDLPPFRGRQSRRVRLWIITGAALIAFAAGLIVGAGRGEAPAQRVAARFTSAWERGDWARMWALSAGPRRPRSSTFASRYRAAAATATVSRIRFGPPRKERDGVVSVPAVVTTRIWGTLRATLRLPVSSDGGAASVRWSSRLVFPGLAPAEQLRRETTLPARADLRFRDNTKMSRFPELAASIAGDLGSIPPDRTARMRALGVPADGLVGISGLQRVFDERLLGRPGGVLYAGRRVLARAVSVPSGDVRTTISPKVQRAAVDALAGRLGGAIALRPGSGEVLGAAGVAWSALQPPGSTFKMITLAGVLEAGLAKASTPFPVATDTTLSGVRLENANAESCGGTLMESFAKSCNSVFAPLGAKLGARRLVAIARRFGFGEAPPIPGAATPSLPPAEQIGDDLAVGSTAIGQGRVEATALQMALVAATIADGGRRPRPTLQLGARLPPARAVSPRVARSVARMMRGVVRFGTGTSAAIPGVPVAGKTGTAELESTVKAAGDQAPEAGATPQDQTQNTDAWFAAFAPSGTHRSPRAAVGVLLVRAGAGGATAAPAARGLLLAALR